jgi:hypothetical protein
MSNDRRLDSWKEIAAYLQRDVRTVQRWESEGLPVCRLRHDKLATVYAQTSEIDAWLNARTVRPDHAPIAEPKPELTESESQTVTLDKRRFILRSGAALAAVGGVLAVAVGFSIAPRRTTAEPTGISVAAASALMGDIQCRLTRSGRHRMGRPRD